MKTTIQKKATLVLLITVCWNPINLKPVTLSKIPQTFTFGNIDRLLNEKTLDHTLLEKAIIYYTNKVRKERGRKPCEFHLKLRNTARSHSREMVRLNYFSHQSPVKANRKLKDRISNAGINIKPAPGETIVMGENIASDYFLKINKVPYYVENRNGKTQYIDAKTEQTITNQTYREFARNTVNNWMNSPGHRKNLLNNQFNRIGIGVWIGKLNDIPAIYVTQNFMGNH